MKLRKKDLEGMQVPKTAQLTAVAASMLVLLILTAAVAYDLGERRTAERILHSDFPVETQAPPMTTSTNEKLLRDQLNRLTNDYESACYRYQELYTAYDALYAQAGTSSGQAKIVRPDGARGNEASCYR